MAFGFEALAVVSNEEELLLLLLLLLLPPLPPPPPVKSEKLKSGMLRSPVLVSTGKYLSHSFWERVLVT